jgi:hypothetical protein
VTVSYDIPDDHADDEAFIGRWRRFGEIVDETATWLKGLPADETRQILADDGTYLGEVSAADVQRKFANLSWGLRTERFDNGGVGGIESRYARQGKLGTWQSASAVVQAGGFAGYAVHGEEGLHFLVLHETSHITELGLRVNDACWKSYRKRRKREARYSDSPEWRFNEQVANQIALQLAAWMGCECLAEPTAGRPARLEKVGFTPTEPPDSRRQV